MTRGLAAGGSFLWQGIQSTVCCLQPGTLGHISFCTVAQHHEGALATWPSLCLLLLAVPRPAAARVSLQEEQFSSFPPCASCERISSAFAAPELRALLPAAMELLQPLLPKVFQHPLPSVLITTLRGKRYLARGKFLLLFYMLEFFSSKELLFLLLHFCLDAP